MAWCTEVTLKIWFWLDSEGVGERVAGQESDTGGGGSGGGSRAGPGPRAWATGMAGLRPAAVTHVCYPPVGGPGFARFAGSGCVWAQRGTAGWPPARPHGPGSRTLQGPTVCPSLRPLGGLPRGLNPSFPPRHAWLGRSLRSPVITALSPPEPNGARAPCGSPGATPSASPKSTTSPGASSGISVGDAPACPASPSHHSHRRPGPL